MTNDELRNQGSPKEWDNSMRQLFCCCPRKFYWFLRGFGAARPASYLAWGEAWHETLRSWYGSPAPFEELSESEYIHYAATALKVGLNSFINSGAEENGDNTQNGLKAIFAAYVSRFRREAWRPVPSGDEAGWLWPLEGTPYFLGGRCDHYIHWDQYGFLVLENKSEGGYLTKNYLRGYDFSSQVTQYAWYLKQLKGDEAFGVLVNCATKKIPGPKSQWSTPRFERVLEQRNVFELELFIEEVLFDIAVCENIWERWNWPRTADHRFCAGSPGNSTCIYSCPCKVCAEGADFTRLDLTTFEGIARREPWKPWEGKTSLNSIFETTEGD